jgi:exodeoxyribonuclease V gamma subunit
MAGLQLYTSNRTEKLVAALAEVVRQPLPSPLAPEVIVVQSRGMERWLAMELARRLGVWAFCRYPFPNAFADEVLRLALGESSSGEAFSPPSLTWRLMSLVPRLLDRPSFGAVARYLKGDSSQLKRYQLCSRLADLFDQYTLYRPDLVLSWQEGGGGDWQADLWREISRGHEAGHRAARKREAIERLRQGAFDARLFPHRVAVFGIPSLPPFHVDLLAAAARFIEVSVFLLSPSPRAEDALSLDDSLSASLGRQALDFLHRLRSLDPARETALFEDPDGDSLFHALQADLLGEHRPGGETRRTPQLGDDSVQVHSCHGPRREVEVLRDQLLAFLEVDLSLEPRDIVVLCPDIESYAPYIQAVFGAPAGKNDFLPFTIADRGARKESALLDGFLTLLDLEGSRLGAAAVLSLLEHAPLRRRFDLDEEDAAAIRRWVEETRIRWGIDSAHRERIGLPGFGENTWRAGLERMLLGHALTRRGSEGFHEVVPFDGIDGSDLDVLGSFLDFTAALFETAAAFEAPRTLRAWAELLALVLDRFFAAAGEEEDDLRMLRTALAELSALEDESGFSEPVGLSVVRRHLSIAMERASSGRGFLRGGVTFCTLLPMRSIPFQVVCLMGMNDREYPRSSRTAGFDLMAREPRPGDRSLRDEDRLLFLESILSARKRLVVSFVGQDAKDGSEREPSVLVSELLDTIDRRFGSASGDAPSTEILRRHRLQAFHPDYFRRSSKLFSFSAEDCGASASRRQRGRRAPFFASALSEPGVGLRTVSPDDLRAFFRGPCRHLLQKRLGLTLGEAEEEPCESESFGLDALESYLVRQDLVQLALDRARPDSVRRWLDAQGRLPHGAHGRSEFDELWAKASGFAAKLRPHLERSAVEAVEVDFECGGFHVVGSVETRRLQDGTSVLRYRCAKLKGKDLVAAWIDHLVLAAQTSAAPAPARAGPGPTRTLLFALPDDDKTETKTATVTLRAPSDPRAELAGLLELYWQGLSRPLLFFPQASWEYSKQRRKDVAEDAAIAEARKEWNKSGDWGNVPGEGKDLSVDLCFRGLDPFDSEHRGAFVKDSLHVYGTLLDHAEFESER